MKHHKKAPPTARPFEGPRHGRRASSGRPRQARGLLQGTQVVVGDGVGAADGGEDLLAHLGAVGGVLLGGGGSIVLLLLLRAGAGGGWGGCRGGGGVISTRLLRGIMESGDERVMLIITLTKYL